MTSRQRRGERAESLARAHLESAGLTFQAANFSCRFGEIDLIMRDKSTLVFVEVRSRSGRKHMHPLESIDSHKQRRLCCSAELYLQRESKMLRVNEPHCRFDVVSILLQNDKVHELLWIEDAFGCSI